MKLDLAEIKPSVYNLVILTFMVVIGLNLAKWLLNKYPIPGLTDLVNAA
jgi:hypothetical protein